MPFPPRLHRLSARRWLRVAVLLVACVIAAPVLADACALPAGSTDHTACFTRFAAAWKARSTSAIVGCMEKGKKVSFSLFAYPLSGKRRWMNAEQAKETLKTYFKKIDSVSLKDVTPKKSPKNVRLYEYGYKASGENARTTHLQVTLKKNKKRLWVLSSVTESAKPRK